MVTIKQIASEVGVSSSTVSRVLNNDTTISVSEETRRSVIQTAQRLNYVNKGRKKSLKKTIKVAVLTVFSEINGANDSYWRQIYLSIVQSAHSGKVIVDDAIRIHQGIDLKLLDNYDAIIVLGELTSTAIQELKKINQHIVLVGSKQHYTDIDAVNPELKSMEKQILNKMYISGRRNIGFIGGNNELLELDGSLRSTTDDVRSTVYREWIRQHNMTENMFISDWRAETGSTGTKALLDQNKNLDALVVASDLIAIGAINTLKTKGLEPGKNIDVVSFDNLELGSYLIPSLSSVDLNSNAIGKTALNQALELVKGKRNWAVWSIVPSILKYRETFNILVK